MTTTAPFMTFAEQIWLILIGGALGGLGELLTELRFGVVGKEVPETAKAGMFLYRECTLTIKDMFSMSIQSIAIGVCGAIAVQFALILLGPLKVGETPPDLLFTISMSTAAGFGARRLLPRLTSQLERNVAALQSSDRQQDDKLNAQKQSLDEQQDLIDAQKRDLNKFKDETEELLLFHRFTEAQNKHSLPSIRQRCIADLNKALTATPGARRYAFRLGRLYKMEGSYGEAIDAMDIFIRAIEPDLSRAIDIADAKYNKSCYYSLMCESGKEEFRVQSLGLLKESFSNPINKKDALIEEDLAFIRNEASLEFNALLA